MAMFTVPVSYTFSGTFTIRAETAREAEFCADRYCGLVLGGDIHSSLPHEDVDWVFPVHPDKKVCQAKRG